MTLYKGNKVIAGSRSYIGNIGDIKYTTRVDLPFGGSWCDGSIKLKAQFPTVYQMLIDGKLQALDIATYESALNLNGSCGFFGLDTATESFRVPSLNDVYIKSGQVADEFGAESLPNITGSGTASYWMEPAANHMSGAFMSSGAYDGATAGQTGSSTGYKGFTFDASRSSSTYQDNAKVNPDHVKYRAYVVLYTGADTNIDITKEIQLNNPFFFGMSQYFEVDPKNASWLKSDGAFHSGSVYESFYNWLVSEYENPDKLPRKANADIVGNPTISDGVVSGFSASSYFCLPSPFRPSNNEWEIVVDVVTSNDVSTSQCIIGNYGQTYQNSPQINIESGLFKIWIPKDGSTTSLFNKSGSYAVKPNTRYQLKLGWNKNEYFFDYSEENGEYIRDITVANSTAIYQATKSMLFGFNSYSSSSTQYFLGSIDLKGSYIKIGNKLWWSGYHNAVRKIEDDFYDYDFVLNTESNSFRLPVKTHLASGNAVCGNGKNLGLTNGITEFGLTHVSGYWFGASSQVGVDIGSTTTTGTALEQRAIGILSDPTKSGIETSSNGLKLYFYVGDVVSDANLLNAGKVLDLLAKLESYDYVVESKEATENDRTWYRKYKSGWVEQGGYTQAGGSVEGVKIPLVLEMNNALYSVSVAVHNGESYDNSTTVRVHTTTNNSFNATGVYSGGYARYYFYWTVSGQGV